jgi:carotenoid cleavage dioxygenase-like enzyme
MVVGACEQIRVFVGKVVSRLVFVSNQVRKESLGSLYMWHQINTWGDGRWQGVGVLSCQRW